jgi:hypothetical protein
MKTSVLPVLASAVAALLLTSCVNTQEPAEPTIVDVESYLEYVQRLQTTANEAPGRAFEPEEIERLNEITAWVLTVLDDVEDLEVLEDDDIFDLMMMNQELHGIITVDGHKSRRVCQFTYQTGSNIPHSVCRTRAQMVEERTLTHLLMDERRRDLENRLWLRDWERPIEGVLEIPHVPLGANPSF